MMKGGENYIPLSIKIIVGSFRKQSIINQVKSRRQSNSKVGVPFLKLNTAKAGLGSQRFYINMVRHVMTNYGRFSTRNTRTYEKIDRIWGI